jgi:hypothetical protein
MTPAQPPQFDDEGGGRPIGTLLAPDNLELLEEQP